MNFYSLDNNPFFIRAVSLYIPLLMSFAVLVWRKPNKRDLTGALLASLWAFPALLLLQACVKQFGWWHFDASGGLLSGIPVDLLVGWVLLWATIPSLLPRSWSITAILGSIVLLDLALMPYLAPVLQLGNQWVVGEIFGVMLIGLPALCVARWTANDSHLLSRVCIQIATFTALLFWLLPEIGVAQGVVDWHKLWLRPQWQISLLAQILAIPALIGLSAVQEFALRGNGTPLPLDPPKQLVTTGIYAYIANPMQLAGSTMLLVFGLSLDSFWFVAGALMACLYSIGIADWSEQDELREQYGEAWVHYRNNVKKWRFRWRPWTESEVAEHGQSTSIGSGILYIAKECGPCSEVRSWFEKRSTIELALVNAEYHPSRDLTRITYESTDGTITAIGVAAVARGLEHIHLGWAMIGFVLRLPGINQLVQIIVDGCGGGPRLIKRVDSIVGHNHITPL